jgi:hypothetical protein
MQTESQLANLRPPIRPGEVLNPKGRNQWSDRAEFRAIVRTLNEAPPEVADPLMEKLAELIVRGAIEGNNGQLLVALLRRFGPI